MLIVNGPLSQSKFRADEGQNPSSSYQTTGRRVLAEATVSVAACRNCDAVSFAAQGLLAETRAVWPGIGSHDLARQFEIGEILKDPIVL